MASLKKREFTLEEAIAESAKKKIHEVSLTARVCQGEYETCQMSISCRDLEKLMTILGFAEWPSSVNVEVLDKGPIN